jgi:hypothetical protein
VADISTGTLAKFLLDLVAGVAGEVGVAGVGTIGIMVGDMEVGVGDIIGVMNMKMTFKQKYRLPSGGRYF